MTDLDHRLPGLGVTIGGEQARLHPCLDGLGVGSLRRSQHLTQRGTPPDRVALFVEGDQMPEKCSEASRPTLFVRVERGHQLLRPVRDRTVEPAQV